MSTDFYNHLHVGDVQKYDSESFVKNSIYFDEASSSEAFNELSDLKEKEGTITSLKAKASELIDSGSHIIKDIAALKKMIPGLFELVAKLNSAGSFTLSQFNSLAKPIKKIENNAVWDSLILMYAANSKPELVEGMQDVLKIFKIQELIQSDDILEPEEAIETWQKLFIVLPSPLFPLPFRENVVEENSTGNSTTDQNVEIYEKIESIRLAREEIVLTFSKQNESRKNEVLSQKDFELNLLRGTNENLQSTDDPNVSEEYEIESLYEDYLSFKSPELLDETRVRVISKETSKTLANLAIKLNETTVPATLKSL